MAGVPLTLFVGEKEVLTTNVDYDDLVILYQQFVDKYDRVPLFKECTAKNNLPQSRIINRILSENKISYNDFLLQFGKVAHVRTPSNPELYSEYVDKFVFICKSQNRTLKAQELTNNKYGLPNIKWFIKYCPNKQVKTYTDFIDYCGLKPNKHVWTKEEVSQILLDYEQEIGRPIIRDDLTLDKIGFSEIVLNRLYGGINKAKEEIGLLKHLPFQPKPFEDYKNIITDIVLDYKDKTGKDYITWKDIESGKFGKDKVGHKALRAAFERAEVDFDSYLLSLGCKLNPNNIAYTYTFEDGERTDSNYEYELSSFLRSLGYKYNQDYYRTVKYSTFSDEESNINCDYLIKTHGDNYYIEVAGIINNYGDEWRTKIFSTSLEEEYKNKMIYKERIMKRNNLHYIFLFADDMRSDAYKKIICGIAERR